ncbi:NADPH2:quinone reductase [Fusarium oxysporum]|nr:NADPH2:quinone reductase [Fusarium oxysporum]
MRVVDIKNGKGPISSLFIREVEKPRPTGMQALVKIKAFGINRMDLIQREGLYPLPPQAGPILGVEFSGVVESLGDDAGSSFQIGDEVFGLAYGGAYADFIAVSTRTLLHKPNELSWEEAAGIPDTWITALQAMYIVGGFEPGKSILWHAGASSVSIAGIQLSKEGGASTIYATAGSQDKIDLTKEIGATEAYNYRTQDWKEALQEATKGRGVDIVVDFIGGPYFDANLQVAAKGGHIIALGALGGTDIRGANLLPFLTKQLYEEYQERLRDLLACKLDKFVSGELKALVHRVFRMEDIQEAHGVLERSETKGKLVCTTGL